MPFRSGPVPLRLQIMIAQVQVSTELLEVSFESGMESKALARIQPKDGPAFGLHKERDLPAIAPQQLGSLWPLRRRRRAPSQR